MTWADYQQWDAQTDAMIAAEMAGIHPRGGGGVIVQGNTIALSPQAETAQEAEAETWRLVLFGRARGQISDNDFDTGWESCAGVHRPSGIVWRSYFWEQTQLFHITPDEGEPFGRDFTLELQSRSSNRGAVTFEESVYVMPVKVTLEEVAIIYGNSGTGPIFDREEHIRDHTFILKRDGASRHFKASAPNTFFYLRPKSITHL